MAEEKEVKSEISTKGEADSKLAAKESVDEYEEGEIPLSDSSSRPTSAGVDSIPSLPQGLHPLENSWTLWFDSPAAKGRQSSWGVSMRNIHTFSTVEDFWRLYNNINPPSKLIMGADFYCFKHKIEPKWEDPICANGGKWTILSSKHQSDIPWLNTLLAMIGEQFDYGEEICGAVVNVRNKQDKISIWTKNAANEAVQMSIGRRWKELLGWKDSLGFIVHDDARKHDRQAKNRYSL